MCKKSKVEKEVAECYSTWGTTYHDVSYGDDFDYPQIHKDFSLRLLEEHLGKDRINKILDAGCGPASLLRYLFRDGWEIYGFDLTSEMVKEGKRIVAEMGYNPALLWQGSVLESSSYIMPQTTPPFSGYDAAICTGVIPHIPQEIESVLFNNLAECLSPGGLLILGGRNELFSLFTMNRYTDSFIRKRLIKEDVLLEKAGDLMPAIKDGLKKFSASMHLDLPPLRGYGTHGYDEILSRTSNPFETKEGVEKAGFKNVKIHFCHFHCLPPMLESIAPEFFKEQSLAMEYSEDWRGYFMASVFLITGVKK